MQKLEADFEFVGDRIHRRTPFASGKVRRWEYFRQEGRAGFGGDASGDVQRLSVQGEVTQYQTGFLAVFQHRGGMRDCLRRGLRPSRRIWNGWRRIGIFPVPVGRRHDGADLACFRERRRLHAQLAKVRGAARLLRPMRHHAGKIRYVAIDQLVLRVIGLMIGSVRADDIDDRRVGAARVVQHGNAIAEAAADMQEREGRCARHTRISVRGTRDDVLLQAQDSTHTVGHPDFIDELHL